MSTNSNRWEQWYEPLYLQKEQLDKELTLQAKWESFLPSATPLPQYRLWLGGGWTLLDGEPIGLFDFDFIEDPHSSFMIPVKSPDEAIGLVRRITGCVALGLEELEDGKYYEWYDEFGNNVHEIADEEGD